MPVSSGVLFVCGNQWGIPWNRYVLNENVANRKGNLDLLSLVGIKHKFGFPLNEGGFVAAFGFAFHFYSQKPEKQLLRIYKKVHFIFWEHMPKATHAFFFFFFFSSPLFWHRPIDPYLPVCQVIRDHSKCQLTNRTNFKVDFSLKCFDRSKSKQSTVLSLKNSANYFSRK